LGRWWLGGLCGGGRGARLLFLRGWGWGVGVVLGVVVVVVVAGVVVELWKAVGGLAVVPVAGGLAMDAGIEIGGWSWRGAVGRGAVGRDCSLLLFRIRPLLNLHSHGSSLAVLEVGGVRMLRACGGLKRDLGMGRWDPL